MSISLVQKRKKKQNRRTKLIADINCIINAITKAYWQKNIQTFLKKTNMEEVKYKRLAMGKKTSTIHFTYFNIYTSNHLIIEQAIDSEVFMKKKMPQYFLNRSTYCNCVHVLRYRLNFSSFLWYLHQRHTTRQTTPSFLRFTSISCVVFNKICHVINQYFIRLWISIWFMWKCPIAKV